MELGCGVGLTGLVALHCSRLKSYTFTDSSEKVLGKVGENLRINGFCPLTSDAHDSSFKEGITISLADFSGICANVVFRGQRSASIWQLDWETCTDNEIKRAAPDIILASGKQL